MHAREAPLHSLVFPAYNPGLVLDGMWPQLQQFLHHEGGDGKPYSFVTAVAMAPPRA